MAKELQRYEGLAPRPSASSTSTICVLPRKAETQFDAAQSSLAAAQAQVALAESQIKSAQAMVASAQAALNLAELRLGWTHVTNKTSGRMTQRGVQAGDYVSVGQQLLLVVPNELYVTANYKETQLTLMRPGQPVDIKVDAFPDQHLHGTVASIQRGSGPWFSLLPPENATGNYVKVVQRVPVKIVFDDTREPERASCRARACRSCRR